MSGKVTAKLATLADKDSVLQMVRQTCDAIPNGDFPYEKFAQVVGYVLEDLDWGFFVLAEEEETKKPVGLLYFTYEFSDWRDGLFFWLQTAFAVQNDQQVHRAMLEFLETY
mmetsp:Transcript_18155/g.31034  ORF Transcript_18155/g.31034 Transcript_18155/m.31034 type:complete len:111 (-) Transcript_18155:158-490(-)